MIYCEIFTIHTLYSKTIPEDAYPKVAKWYEVIGAEDVIQKLNMELTMVCKEWKLTS